MKRAALCILLLVLCAAFASADRLMFLGMGGSYATENRDTLPLWSEKSVAVHFGNFTGTSFGIYSNASMGYILSAKTGGVTIDVNDYDFRLSIETVLGLGYRLPIDSPMLAIVGAGLYVGIVAMLPKNFFDPLYGGSITLGPGIQATVSFPVTPGLYAGLSLGAAYSLWEPAPLDETTEFKNGIHMFGGVGIAFSL